ncbi:MAG TPA: succinyl-diaminopimelate desuccinylase [Stellaceae bacterium]|nr:succinyl-diaminopimelate desuccinylase [Stellaceae bacterium]
MPAIDPAILAAELIRRPSVTPKDEGALEIVARALEGLGFTCHRLTFDDPGPNGEEADPIANLYARKGAGSPNLCFAGHTDVVPVGAAQNWSFDPFAAVLKDGVLCGRGAVDMKGAIAAFVTAAEAFLAKRGGNFAGSISFLITGDEEGVAINGTRKVLDWLAKRGEVIDACVVGEPTSATQLGDMIKIGRRGSMTGRITVEGVQGHVAYPHLADNAAHRLVALLSGLTAPSLDNGTEHFQKSGLQVTTIDIGNPTTNIIPGQAKATFNIRFNDLWTSDKLKSWAKEALDAVDLNYKLTWEVIGESFLVPPGKVSDCLSGAIHAVTGLEPELSTTGGTSDARFIHRHCPVAEFGLVSQTMHKVDERVDVADITRLVAIYGGFLDRFFGNA